MQASYCGRKPRLVCIKVISNNVLSVPWHLLSFWDFIVDFISASVGIASLTLTSGGTIWGKRWGISGWHSTFRISKCLAKCSFNFEGSSRSFFDLFRERANLNSSSTSRDLLAVLIAAAFLRNAQGWQNLKQLR